MYDPRKNALGEPLGGPPKRSRYLEDALASIQDSSRAGIGSDSALAANLLSQGLLQYGIDKQKAADAPMALPAGQVLDLSAPRAPGMADASGFVQPTMMEKWRNPFKGFFGG